MKSSDAIGKLAAALCAAQAEFKSVGKSGENKFDKYSYANLEDYVTAVRPVLTKHGIVLLSSAEEIIPLDDRQTKNGGCEHAVRVKLTTRIVHESGEWIETSSCGEGQDRADKSVYKAITGARKYALASALNLATTDDPEDEDEPHPEVKPSSRKTPGKPVDSKEAARAVPEAWLAKMTEAQQEIAAAKTIEELEALKIVMRDYPEEVKVVLRPLVATKQKVIGSAATVA